MFSPLQALSRPAAAPPHLWGNPDRPLFSDIELQVLHAYAKKTPQTAINAFGNRATGGRIGGHLGRKHDPPPGQQLMWQGYQQLQLMCEGFALRDTNDLEDDE